MPVDDDLVAACEAKDPQAAAAALKAGASPDAVNPTRGMRVLEIAIQSRTKRIVKLLVTSGANVTARDERGRNALHLLAEHFPDVSLGALVLDRGAPVDALDNVRFERRAPLHRAVQKRKLDFAELLLDRGADINVGDGVHGYTPLHLLAKSESGAMSPSEITAAFWLVRKGADVSHPSFEGVTPLHFAAGSGSHEVVQGLLAHGATISRDRWGNTPLYYCLSTHKRDIQIWTTLIAAGCGVNDRNERGHTPLHEAQSSWNDFAVQFLISKGADLAARDSQGKTTFERAQTLGQEKILKTLQLQAVAGR